MEVVQGRPGRELFIFRAMNASAVLKGWGGWKTFNLWAEAKIEKMSFGEEVISRQSVCV